MKTMKSFLLAGGIALGTLVSACATPLSPMQSSRGPQLPDPGPDHEYQVVFPEGGSGAVRHIHLTLGEDIARDCGLVRTHFEFDSAEPLPQDQIVLRSLAECLNRPELARMELWLVGRTDSRGSTEYNLGLADRRADRVKELLVKAGMTAGRISTSSGGKLGALGDDVVYSYGYDRRVDAIVVGVVHAPR